jgi:hypothetical protein
MDRVLAWYFLRSKARLARLTRIKYLGTLEDHVRKSEVRLLLVLAVEFAGRRLPE